MGTTLRPELSEKNKYWIERHRYYELKHFCLQYPLWRKGFADPDGLAKRRLDLAPISKTNTHSDPVVSSVEIREYYLKWMQLVEQTAIATDADLYRYIIKGVTEGISYEHLKARLDIPCCKDTYYHLYRRFFWLLDKERK